MIAALETMESSGGSNATYFDTWTDKTKPLKYYGIYQISIGNMSDLLNTSDGHFKRAFRGLNFNKSVKQSLIRKASGADQTHMTQEEQKLLWLVFYFVQFVGAFLYPGGVLPLNRVVDCRKLIMANMAPKLIGKIGDGDFNALCGIYAKKKEDHQNAFRQFIADGYGRSWEPEEKKFFLNLAWYNNGWGSALARVLRNSPKLNDDNSLEPSEREGWDIDTNSFFRHIMDQMTDLNKSVKLFTDAGGDPPDIGPVLLANVLKLTRHDLENILAVQLEPGDISNEATEEEIAAVAKPIFIKYNTDLDKVHGVSKFRNNDSVDRNEYDFYIGDINFVVPPTSFKYNSSSQSYAFQTLRTSGNPVVPINTQRPSVTITLYLDGADQINNQLRPLVAMSKRAPFTQARSRILYSLLIDRAAETQSGDLSLTDPMPIVIDNLSFHTVPGYPDSVQVFLTVRFFNMFPYGIMRAYRPSNVAEAEQVTRYKINEVLKYSRAFNPVSARENRYVSHNGEHVVIPDLAQPEAVTTRLHLSPEFITFYREQLQDFDPSIINDTTQPSFFVEDSKRWKPYIPEGAPVTNITYNRISNLKGPVGEMARYVAGLRRDIENVSNRLKLINDLASKAPDSELAKYTTVPDIGDKASWNTFIQGQIAEINTLKNGFNLIKNTVVREIEQLEGASQLKTDNRYIDSFIDVLVPYGNPVDGPGIEHMTIDQLTELYLKNTTTLEESIATASPLLEIISNRYQDEVKKRYGSIDHEQIVIPLTDDQTPPVDPSTPVRVLNSLNVSYANKLVPIDIAQYHTPTFQHLGMGQFGVGLNIHTNDESFIRALNDIRLTQTGMISQQNLGRGMDRITINDPLLGSFGLTEFTIRNVTISSIPGGVNWYEIIIDLIHNPRRLHDIENLQTLGKLDKSYIKSCRDYFFPTTLDVSIIEDNIPEPPEHRPQRQGGPRSIGTVANFSVPKPWIDPDYMRRGYKLYVKYDTLIPPVAFRPGRDQDIDLFLIEVTRPIRRIVRDWRDRIISEMSNIDGEPKQFRSPFIVMIENMALRYMEYVYQATLLWASNWLFSNWKGAGTEPPTKWLDLTDDRNIGVSKASNLGLQTHALDFMQTLFLSPTFNTAVDNIRNNWKATPGKPNPSWVQYSSRSYGNFISNAHRRTTNNYPDFDFPEHYAAEVYSMTSDQLDSRPIDTHKIMHPAWYLATARTNNSFDITKELISNVRLMYQAQISQIMTPERVDELREVMPQVLEWLVDETASGVDDNFHKVLSSALANDNQTTTIAKIKAGTWYNVISPKDLAGSSLIEALNTIGDQSHLFQKSATILDETINFNLTKHQMYTMILGNKLALHQMLRKMTGALLGIEDIFLSTDIDKTTGKFQQAKIVLGNGKKGTPIKDLKTLFPLISRLGADNLTESKLKDIQNEYSNTGVLAYTRIPLVSILHETQLEIQRMLESRDIDSALKEFGFIDFDSAVLQTKLDHKMASQRSNELEDSFLKAFPTFKMFIIEEDAAQWRMFDDFYSYDAVQSIDVVDSKHSASSTALIRLSNVTGKLTNAGVETLIRDSDKPVFMDTLALKVGSTILIRMGYGPDYRNLPTTFHGSITEIGPGPVLEIRAQSYGVELLHDQTEVLHFKDARSKDGVLTALLDATPGLKHFGRWEMATSKMSQFSDMGNRTLSALHKIANVAWLGGGLFDINHILDDQLGITAEDLGVKDTADFVASWKDGTNPYSMLLNFGNKLYENIYINRNNPRTSGFFGFMFDGYATVADATKADFHWSVFNQTTWDALWELALFHGDYIVRPLPYNEGSYLYGEASPRMTLYWGPREGYYKTMDDPYRIEAQSASAVKEVAKEIKASMEASYGGALKVAPGGLSPIEKDTVKAIYKTLRTHALDLQKTRAQDYGLLYGGDLIDNLPAIFLNFFGIGETFEVGTAKLMIEELEKANFTYLPQLLTEFVLPMIDTRVDVSPFLPSNPGYEKPERRDPLTALAFALTLGYYDLYHTTGTNWNPTSMPDFWKALQSSDSKLSKEQYTVKWRAAIELDMAIQMTYAEVEPNSPASSVMYNTTKDIAKQMQDEGRTNHEVYRPIVEHHRASSDTNIMINEITTTADSMSNKVSVYYPEKGGATTPQRTWPAENKRVSAISYELDPNYIREYSSFQKNARADILHTADIMHMAENQAIEQGNSLRSAMEQAIPEPQHLATQILCNQMKPMYQGKLVLTGNAAIRPWHMVHLVDTVNSMDGTIEVEQVVHSLNPQTGFTTTITPNLVIGLRDNSSLIDVQLMDVQAKIQSNIRLARLVSGGVWNTAKLWGTVGGLAWLYGAVAGTSLALTWPILLTSGFASFGYSLYKNEELKMKQYINSMLLQYGNAPLVLAPLHYRNNPYLAGMEGIDTLTRNTSTILLDSIIDSSFDPDSINNLLETSISAIAGETGTLIGN